MPALPLDAHPLEQQSRTVGLSGATVGDWGCWAWN
jgi:hypothetical protein